MSEAEPVTVAVGIVWDKQGRVLLAKRHPKQHQGGLWEFPGGKVEMGETPFAALVRELQEEVALVVHHGERLLTLHHDYGDKQVVLDVWQTTDFSGQAVGLEGQPLQWVTKEKLPDYEFPAANQAIVEHLLKPINV